MRIEIATSFLHDPQVVFLDEPTIGLDGMLEQAIRMNTAHQLSSFVKYPLDIFDQAVRFVLTWCLPFAFTAYMPVLYLLRNDTSMLLWTPLIAALAFAAAYRFWLIGIAHHETTGS